MILIGSSGSRGQYPSRSCPSWHISNASLEFHHHESMIILQQTIGTWGTTKDKLLHPPSSWLIYISEKICTKIKSKNNTIAPKARRLWQSSNGIHNSLMYARFKGVTPDVTQSTWYHYYLYNKSTRLGLRFFTRRLRAGFACPPIKVSTA